MRNKLFLVGLVAGIGFSAVNSGICDERKPIELRLVREFADLGEFRAELRKISIQDTSSPHRAGDVRESPYRDETRKEKIHSQGEGRIFNIYFSVKGAAVAVKGRGNPQAKHSRTTHLEFYDAAGSLVNRFVPAADQWLEEYNSWHFSADGRRFIFYTTPVIDTPGQVFRERKGRAVIHVFSARGDAIWNFKIGERRVESLIDYPGEYYAAIGFLGEKNDQLYLFDTSGKLLNKRTLPVRGYFGQKIAFARDARSLLWNNQEAARIYEIRSSE